MRFLSKNVGYIYLALWMFYYLQEMLMIVGIIAQSILVVLLVMSFYAFFQVNKNFRTCPYLKWLNVMLLVLSVYGVIPIIGEWTLTGNNKAGVHWMTYLSLQNIYMSVLPIYAFYYYAVTKRVTSSNLFPIYIAFFLFSILMYYQNFFSTTERLGREEITNNAGFFFVPLIPMLQLLKIRDFWKYLLLMVTTGYLLMAMKRGAILAGVVMIIMFMIHHFKNISWKQFINTLCLSVIVLFAIYYFTIHLYADSDFFQVRIEQTLSGDASGRNKIYSSYLTYFIERTSAVEFMIGNGTNATRVLFGQYAHDDWLEFAINQGILGVMIYLIYWIVFIWEWKNYKGPNECRQVLGDLIITYFLIALYSMSFDGMPFAATLCIGYCLARNRKIIIKHVYR